MRRTVKQPASLLDELAALQPDSSRTTLRQMLVAGRVRVNGETEKNAKRQLEAGDTIDVGRREAVRLLPEEIAVLHEDDDVIVIVKSEGLLTVASPSEKDETVQAYLNTYLKSKGEFERIHIVHRIDRGTSGVLVFARNFPAREALKAQFADHSIERVYLAIVEGVVRDDHGTFQSYLREEADLRMRSVNSASRGKLAITHYRVTDRGKRYTRVEVRLETGRKNQIRVHFAEAGHPVAGDTRYGAATDPIGRLALHAQTLGFVHPTTGAKLSFTAPVPDSFRRLAL